MGGINVGGGGHGKKAVDSEIPLVPFIDLLLCCIMFLLVTAVWNQLARINANQQQPGAPSSEVEPPEEEEKIKLILQVQNTGYVLASTAGEEFKIPKAKDEYDVEGLREKLQERRRLEPNRTDIIVAPEDGVLYKDLVTAMDVAVGTEFKDVTVSDAAIY